MYVWFMFTYMYVSLYACMQAYMHVYLYPEMYVFYVQFGESFAMTYCKISGFNTAECNQTLFFLLTRDYSSKNLQ